MSQALRIGLTGGIGSGKSTVAALLAARGALLVDTDALSRALTGPGGAAMPALRERFGAAIATPNGALDRARMRELAFADGEARRALEAILHPLIGARADELARGAAAAQPVVFDVPLLVESARWRERVARVVVVDCSVETQVQRVAARPGWDAAAARRVIAQQATRAQRRAAADAVLFNDGLALAALQGQVDALWALWCT